MLMGMLLGLVGALVIVAALIWYFYAKPSEFKTPDQVPDVKAPAAPVQSEAPPLTESPAVGDPGTTPQSYSFYDILPGSQAPKPAEPPKAKELWWLQVAALKSAEDADRLKAQLTLLNLNTVVQPLQGNGATLYRVRVGPFKSESAAQSAQDTLAVNNFEPRLLKEAVNP
jgi:cell division protein FtsN